MQEKNHKDFVPVMITPFKDDGGIDFDGLTQLTEFYLQSGVKGLFANCQSSEMFLLSNEERLQIIGNTIKIADGKVPVVAVGNFGTTLEEQAAFIQKVYDTGVKAVIVVTGLVAAQSESQEMFDDKMFELFKLTGNIPLGFYECPEPYKRVLTAGQLRKFVETGRIIYHKDTCLSANLVKEKLEATKEFNEFGLYDAYASNSVSSLNAGAAGLSCIQGNFFPEIMVWLCDHHADENVKELVNKVQQFLTNHMQVMHYAYPIVAKYFLQKRGVNISTFTRAKTKEFTRDAQHNVDLFFKEYELLKKELAI